MPLLTMDNVTKKCKGITVLNRVNLSVNAGEIVAILGSARSDKTLLLDLITGLTKPTDGQIIYRGEPLGARPLHQYISIGIARTFHPPLLFENLTVGENVLAGTHCRGSWKLTGALHRFFAPCVRKEENLLKYIAMDCLKKAGLADKAGHQAKNLSLFEQKRLELARAIAAQPVLLLMDTPATGLDSHEQNDLKPLLKELTKSGTTIILTEENHDFIKDICTRSLLLNNGTIKPQQT
ncbi:ABC transporter ATP-binding protein [Thermincola potens]|uniref:ABC transporter related protein n=1 Tax=Thermincola potens (strain JR) TaxID=635013 RepID=D5XD10_THEPJ|nr:ATP-binding cassette domain-containing protein [Thermincola potens]ADG83686.1 ABC transporter related protein [Thermincola potens JR]